MVQLHSARVPLGVMEFPSPIDKPQVFLDYLKAGKLDFAIKAFEHYLIRPNDTSNWLDGNAILDWCERMDAFLVS